MLLVLVRHAKAFERDQSAWPDDLRRPLTAAGRESFARLAKRLGHIYPTVDAVLASPATRAWQTARILHERGGWPEPVRDDRLLPDVPGDDVEAVAAVLASAGGKRSLALVGHEPTIGRVASWLLAGQTGRLRIEVRKGAAIGLEIAEDRLQTPAGAAALSWMMTPKMARSKGRK